MALLPDKPLNDSRFLLDVLVQHTKAQLKEALQKAVEPLIDETVEKAVGELKLTLERGFYQDSMHGMIKVVLEKRDRKNGP